MVRILVAAVLLLGAALAFAKVLPGQFKPCDKKNACEAGLQCLATTPKDKTKCELVCKVNGDCPEDQRCIKDGAHLVCRNVQMGVPGL